MKNRSLGFSLIRVSATVTIAGVVVGAALKAQGMIELSKVHRLRDDFRQISLHLNEYQQKYQALPGDDPTIGSALSHLNNAVSCSSAAAGRCVPGNGVIDGDWNDTTPASESFLFWQHIRLAGLASGATDPASGDYQAMNVVGGSLGITSQSASPIASLKGVHLLCSDGIAGKFARQLDTELDDGSTATGYMMATSAGITTGGTAIASDAIVDGDLYLVCMGI